MDFSKIIPFLLIGSLSVLIAEVYSGASQAWFIDAWGLLMVFPLYASHALFFLNIALRTKKTSLVQLYFFGILFALYESWITKVVWYGYPNAATPSPTILGIAYSEFSIIIFFWHALMSFIAPIIVFQILSGKILKEHSIFKTKNKTTLLVIASIVFAAFNTNNSNFNILLSNLAIIGTMLIVALLAKFLPKNATIYSLKLGNKGFMLLISYLLILYGATFFLLLPERIPSAPLPIILIILFYAFIAFVLKKSKPVKEELIENKTGYNKKDLLKFSLITIISANIFCIIPGLPQIVMIIAYLTLTLTAPILFIFNLLKINLHKKF